MIGVGLLDVASELLQLHINEFADFVHLGLQLHQPWIVIDVFIHLLILPRTHCLQPRHAHLGQPHGFLAGLSPGEMLLRVALIPGLAFLAELAVVIASWRSADGDEGEAVQNAASLGNLHRYQFINIIWNIHHSYSYKSTESCLLIQPALYYRFTTSVLTWKFYSSTTSPPNAPCCFFGL